MFNVPYDISAVNVPRGLKGPSRVCPLGLAAAHPRTRNVTHSMMNFRTVNIMGMTYGVLINGKFETLLHPVNFTLVSNFNVVVRIQYY